MTNPKIKGNQVVDDLVLANSLTFVGGGAVVDEFSTDGTLAGDSDTASPTEKAVKTYVDAQVGGLSSFFLAELSTSLTAVTGDSTPYPIIYDTEIADIGNDYNNTTGILTAPVTGYYIFFLTVHINPLPAGHTAGFLDFSATTNTQRVWEIDYSAVASSNNRLRYTTSWIAKLTATNTAYMSLRIDGASKDVGIESGAGRRTTWSGYLLTT